MALVFLLLAITFIVLGIGNSALAGTLKLTNGTIKLGGWIGLATAIAAWYASFAGVVNSTLRPDGLPGLPAEPLRKPIPPRRRGVQLRTDSHIAAQGAGANRRRPPLTQCAFSPGS